jgi:hypothetical protein
MQSAVRCSDNTLAVNEAYDPVTDTWSTKAPKPTAVAGACAFVLSNRGYVVSLTVNEVYDPDTNTWSTAESPPSSTARNYAAAFAISDVGYMAGGISGSTVSSVVEAFVPSTVQDAAAQAIGGLSFYAAERTARTYRIDRIRSVGLRCSASPSSGPSNAVERSPTAGRQCSASVLGISAIAIQVAGSSAVFGRPTAPVDVGAASIGSSMLSAFPQYSATLMPHFATGSACLVDVSRARNDGACHHNWDGDCLAISVCRVRCNRKCRPVAGQNTPSQSQRDASDRGIGQRRYECHFGRAGSLSGTSTSQWLFCLLHASTEHQCLVGTISW